MVSFQHKACEGVKFFKITVALERTKFSAVALIAKALFVAGTIKFTLTLTPESWGRIDLVGHNFLPLIMTIAIACVFFCELANKNINRLIDKINKIPYARSTPLDAPLFEEIAISSPYAIKEIHKDLQFSELYFVKKALGEEALRLLFPHALWKEVYNVTRENAGQFKELSKYNGWFARAVEEIHGINLLPIYAETEPNDGPLNLENLHNLKKIDLKLSKDNIYEYLHDADKASSSKMFKCADRFIISHLDLFTKCELKELARTYFDLECLRSILFTRLASYRVDIENWSNVREKFISLGMKQQMLSIIKEQFLHYINFKPSKVMAYYSIIQSDLTQSDMIHMLPKIKPDHVNMRALLKFKIFRVYTLFCAQRDPSMANQLRIA